jgi:hypothetical protein
MEKVCEHCNKEFTISDDEMSMYKKVGIELPCQCFLCRTKHLLSFWLFGKFRRGKSNLSGDNLITVLPEKSRYPIYTLHEWYSDTWDAMDYEQDYDSSKSFFTQLQELQEKIPRPHQNGAKSTNCDWCDDVWNCKDSYLARSMVDCENLFYSYRNIKVKNSIDVVVCFDSERCFDCVNCYSSYRLFYSRNSKDCIDSYFLEDCRNCQNCFMCWNLRGKSYQIENKIPTYFFIAVYEGWNQPFSFIKCNLLNVYPTIKDEQLELVPAYIHPSRNAVNTWFEIDGFSRLATEEVKRLQLATTGREVSSSLRGTTAIFRVVVTGDTLLKTAPLELKAQKKQTSHIDDDFVEDMDDDADYIDDFISSRK